MKAVKVRRDAGESTRQRLMEEGLLDTSHRIATDGDNIYFPVINDVEWAENLEMEFEKLPRVEAFEDKLSKIVPPDLIPLIRTFDSIGDIAVMEFDDALLPYSKGIANAFLEAHKHFRTVLLKGGSIDGQYRTRRYEFLAGERRTSTRHKEYGLAFELDLDKVFFTPRLANERKRVTDMVRSSETVIDMFCGIGPFSISIAKYSQPSIIYSIDLNSDAIEYLKKNIEINGVSGIVPICGDANYVIKGLPQADRIIMNLPKISHKFLRSAVNNVRENGVIHYYTIMRDEELEGIRCFIEQVAEQHGREAYVLNTIKIKPYSPYTFMTAFDIRIV